MGEHYKGDATVVEWGTDDISGTERTVSVEETASEPPDIDVSHKGDTQQQVLEGIPGPTKTSASVNALDETGATLALKTLTVGDKKDLKVYPEGKIHEKPMITVANSRLLRRRRTYPYNDAVDIEVSFSAKEAISEGTYDSSA